MSEAKSWREYYERMKQKAPLTIYYPICGGGEECITACPYGEKIWDVKPMKVSLFGFNEKVRLRPVMKNPELCKECYLCVEACPTGALRPGDKSVKHPFLTLVYNTLKLPFKKKYNIKFVFRPEHVEKFKHNNGR
ncbi:MAG: ferredoxin family protein [Thermococcus sp.]|uniref:4Fe-4S dicluster domain-containing protein n=1 Tax=Thermococcus sp. TaxID=35749 RepID=UPI001D62598C|nr:ferredoxin family protein [Thermococcus sp.]MBO8175580.1 ferredoxin family protein [Thermococcus sp.]